MKANPLRANWELVRLTESALRHGAEGLDSLPGMLRELLATEAWRSFQHPNGGTVTHERLAEFVSAPPPRGLGTTIELVRRLVAKDTTALDLLDQAMQNPVGHPPISNIITDRAPAGTSTAKALRRLRKDRPDLHAKVLASELTPHRAMVEAGFRHRTITVPVDDAGRLAATLKRRLEPETLAQLAKLLGGAR